MKRALFKLGMWCLAKSGDQGARDFHLAERIVLDALNREARVTAQRDRLEHELLLEREELRGLLANAKLADMFLSGGAPADAQRVLRVGIVRYTDTRRNPVA